MITSESLTDSLRQIQTSYVNESQRQDYPLSQNEPSVWETHEHTELNHITTWGTGQAPL